MRLNTRLFTLLLALLVVFVGAAAAEEWPDLSGQTVNVVALWTGDEQRKFEDVLAEFSALTGAEIVYSPTPENLATVLGTRVEGGSPPDIAALPNPGLLQDFARRGFLVAVDDIVGDLVDQYYAPVWRELASVDGKLYGVWYKAANKSVVWYNTNIFAEVGAEVPTTWEEMMEVAEMVDFYGITPFSAGGGSSWVLTDWFENIYLRVAGPEMYDKLVRHEISWTDPTVIEAFEYLKQVLGRPEWLAGGVEGTLEANHPQGIIKPFVDPPQAAMVYGADFSVSAISTETNAVVGEDALFFPFPSIKGSPAAVVGGGDVAVMMKDTPGARALLRFLATPKAAEIWASQGGLTSPNKGVDLSVYPNEIVAASAKALQEAEWFRFDLSDLVPQEFGSTAGTGMRGGFQEFVRNPDIEAITRQLEEDAKKAY
ncbi:MAG: extracellular solute-binding protein [Firmicutes bacterium]|jgi:alpha-glucoside transport system substrate-binding protein|nr:extracellular solute-binding protein [Bacillota bacterium]